MHQTSASASASTYHHQTETTKVLKSHKWSAMENNIIWYLDVVFIASQWFKHTKRGKKRSILDLTIFRNISTDQEWERECWQLNSAYHSKSFRLYTTIFDILFLVDFYDFHDFAERWALVFLCTVITCKLFEEGAVNGFLFFASIHAYIHLDIYI